MSKTPYMPLRSSLKSALKRNRRSINGRTVGGIILGIFLVFSCAAPEEQGGVSVDAWFSAAERDVLQVAVYWDTLPTLTLSQSRGDRLERSISYDLLLRTSNSFFKRVNLEHYITVSYDPYHDVYSLEQSETEGALYFPSLNELRNYLRGPIIFECPISSLLLEDDDDLIVQVMTSMSNLSTDSVFQNWFEIISPNEHEGYATVHGVVRE